ncbi:helix-turn-helix transcriptional regulator (plasmid) [Candidatus Liberibacter asiaticus]
MFLNPFLETSLKSLQEYTLIITPEIRQYWKDVGTRIRDIRKSKDKTLDEIAKEANQTESTIWKFENGLCSTSINYALCLRNEYEISFDWIYDGETTCALISMYESGKRTPRITTAQNIKQATKKHLDWIYFGDEVIVPKSIKRAKGNQSSKKSKKDKKSSNP